MKKCAFAPKTTAMHSFAHLNIAIVHSLTKMNATNLMRMVSVSF